MFPDGIVGYVGHHRPNHRRTHTNTDADGDLTGNESNHTSMRFDGEEPNHGTHHRNKDERTEEGGLLPNFLCKRYSKGHTCHLRQFTDGQKHSAGDEYICAQDVGKIIGSCTTTDRTKQELSDACPQQQPPWAVFEQVLHVFLDGLLLFLLWQLHSFACHQKAKDEKNSTQHSYDSHNHRPLHGRGIAYPFDDIACRIDSAYHMILKKAEQSHSHKTTDVGKEHAIGRKHRFFVTIFCHHTEHRTIRHVDRSVHRHHHQIGDVGINMLERVASIGSVKRKNPDQGKRQSHPQQPRTITSPARAGAIGNQSHHRV